MPDITPLGIVLKVDDEYWVAMFSDPLKVTVPQGSTLAISSEDVQLGPWVSPGVAGLLPLRTALDGPSPKPPKFATIEEADAWLDAHPALGEFAP